MQKLIIIPTIISSLRIVVLPLFIYLYNSTNIIPCLILLAFSASTDFFDGYLARKLKATSKFGAYYDATTDFALVIGIFAFFTIKGYYPIWLPLLIAAAFIQFIVTSHYSKKIYDPSGQIHWKRPLHWNSFNSCFPNPSNIQLRSIRLYRILFSFAYKPNNKFGQKKC